MIKLRIVNRCVIFALILLAGFGAALAFPWFAGLQSQAAYRESSATSSLPHLQNYESGFGLSSEVRKEVILDSEYSPNPTTRYYVAGTGDGTAPTLGWSTAFTNVQDALAAAAPTGGEIWVAAGIYYPDQGVGQIDNSVSSTFVLTDDVTLYGGFDTSDTQLSDRDWKTNLTILSGDIDGDDVTDGNGVVTHTSKINGNNAYHVVSAREVTRTAVLDGFTITAGYAPYDLDEIDEMGGGLYCNGSESSVGCSPTLINLVFSGNYAYNGGALYNDGWDGFSSPSLKDVVFTGNSANRGGAMYNYGSHGFSIPSLLSVTFSGNSAIMDGGAIYNYCYHSESNCSASLTNTTFYTNSADRDGGAFYNWGPNGNSSPSLVNAIFSGNSAGRHGGAMYNYNEYEPDRSASLVNVLFSGNSAVGNGGAMYNYNEYYGANNPSLTNATFSGNSAGGNGGAMFNDGEYNGVVMPDVCNSILWNNQDTSGTGTLSATIYNSSASVTLTHSLAQGTGGSSSWTPDSSYVNGGDNIDTDPFFVWDVDPVDAPTVDGDLRLVGFSPPVNAGDNSCIPGVLTDLDGKPRIFDGTVDMGTYEWSGMLTYLPLILNTANP